MKQLLLIRHAKSSWDSPTFKDFDRPLNDRGHRDAPMMAERLIQQKISIDVFITSTALRAIATARYFHKAYKAMQSQLFPRLDLYHAQPEIFYDVISTLKDDWKTVAIFAHNPGITDMVNSLKVARVLDMPTCAIFGVSLDTKHWLDFEKMEKRFLLFDYPKG